MTDFIITAPNGKKYKVSGPDQAGAVAALKKMLGTPEAAAPQAKPAAVDGGMVRRAEDRAAPPPPDAPAAKQTNTPERMLATEPPIATTPQQSEYERNKQSVMDAAQPNLPPPAVARAPEVRMVMNPKTGTEMPEQVTTGDGTVLYLDPKTGSYTNAEWMAEGMKPTQGQAVLAGAAQGFTVGTMDEILGAVDGPMGREKARAARIAAGRDYPKTTTAAEIGGALALPIKGVRTTSIKTAAVEGAKLGAKVGAAYSAATAEGGVLPRIKAGFEGAISGAVFGAAVPVVVGFGSKAFRRMFEVSAKKPTIESLRVTKKTAYDAVDSAGEKFAPADVKTAYDRAVTALDDVNYLPEADIVTKGVLSRLESISAREMTLGQIDKFRQDVWKRYNTSKEPGLLEIIDSLDEMVTARTATSELLDAARLANSRYKKAELLDLAFTKAADQTAATGSGGNVLNKMRQAVTAIINNPKQAKWFSGPEIEAMRLFVRGDATQNTLRLIGKLAPTGNGLMTALNLMAVSVNPGAILVSAGASGAKAIADRATQRGADALIGRVAGQPAAAAPATSYNSRAAIPGAMIGNALVGN